MINSLILSAAILFGNLPSDRIVVSKINRLPRKYLIIGNPHKKTYKVRIKAKKIHFLEIDKTTGFESGLLKYIEKKGITNLPDGNYTTEMEFDPFKTPNLILYKINP